MCPVCSIMYLPLYALFCAEFTLTALVRRSCNHVYGLLMYVCTHPLDGLPFILRRIKYSHYTSDQTVELMQSITVKKCSYKYLQICQLKVVYMHFLIYRDVSGNNYSDFILGQNSSGLLSLLML